MSPQALPRLAITMGDPAGVGPELAIRALVDRDVRKVSIPIVIGDRATLEAAAELLQVDLQAWEWIPRDVFLSGPDIDQSVLVDLSREAPGPFVRGKISAAGGKASYEYLVTAIEAARSERVDAIVTAPINKESLHLAAVPYPGHTEILTEATGCCDSGMMLTAPTITCSLVTTHVSLAAVPKLLNVEKILRLIRLTDKAMRRIRQRPSIHLTVLGLNPHAGEGGLFGDEEQRIIRPAVETAQREGFDIEGPLPPDTAFTPRVRQRTDAYICMYHDQGLIPLKALAFEDAVNVTLGLPIVRTSVDHGTAFDIAWTGQADFSSMRSAMELAARLATQPAA